MRRIAAVVLVDARGWLLLQERDDRTRLDPDSWSLVGGGVEDGETDAEAAVRELAEETEVTGTELTHVETFDYYCGGCSQLHPMALFTAQTDLTDADIVCHEGRQIAFVDPTTIDTLPWTRSLAFALPRIVGHPSYVERFGRREPRRFGCVIPVDARGWVLLQERDEHAPIDPERWGVCGGHLDGGEPPREGALRELEEETGLRLGADALHEAAELRVFHPHYGSVDHVHVYAARVDLTDADIDCQEGRQIVFVEPRRARDLDLTMTGVIGLPSFLDSDLYRTLTETTDREATARP